MDSTDRDGGWWYLIAEDPSVSGIARNTIYQTSRQPYCANAIQNPNVYTFLVKEE